MILFVRHVEEALIFISKFRPTRNDKSQPLEDNINDTRHNGSVTYNAPELPSPHSRSMAENVVRSDLKAQEAYSSRTFLNRNTETTDYRLESSTPRTPVISMPEHGTMKQQAQSCVSSEPCQM